MTAYFYRCRESSPEHPSGAEQFIDGPEWADKPFLSRPEGQRLNAVLKSGDIVMMALEEFPQSAEAFRVLGDWDGRGVEILFLHPEPGFPTFRRLIDKTMTWIDGAKKAWAGEAAAESAVCN